MTLRTWQLTASRFCARFIGYPLILAAAMLTWGVASSAESSDIINMQQISDLRQEAEIVRARNLVLVLEFSREDCPYCRKLEKLFLLPMQRNAHYDDKILVRSISLDANETVIDFAGRSVATDQFATRYGVSMTPTLLFLNPDGVEIGERLVGIWSEDFYGYFIDSRIDAARESL
ncbi:MAG TPA: thioredoxin fold domain-containing protein [Gammaproteobacteria bacterium]|nr:thioredoxin fold domain-containing protein [Gammaproteobacteria bacterium]